MFCKVQRMPCSLARNPYDTETAGSTCAVAVARAGSEPLSPVYHKTVLALVPATSAVALSNGGPATRCGGLPKKSLPARTAEAAISDVLASLPSELASVACRFAAVAAAVAPIVNWFAAGGDAVVAVNITFSLVPSGRLRRTWMLSPSLGRPPLKSTDTDGGTPAGPLTV